MRDNRRIYDLEEVYQVRWDVSRSLPLPTPQRSTSIAALSRARLVLTPSLVAPPCLCPPLQTGHKQSGAVRIHKSNLHRTVYTGTADRNDSAAANRPARMSVFQNRTARMSMGGGGGVGRESTGGHSDGRASGSIHRHFTGRESQVGGDHPMTDGDGKISMQFSNYLTMTHTEARRIQSISRDVDTARNSQTTLGSVRLALLRQQVWSILSEPDSSIPATVVAFLILGLIFISTITFCLETVPFFQRGASAEVFRVIEKIAIAVFTAEYVLRLFSAPRKIEFAKARCDACGAERS